MTRSDLIFVAFAVVCEMATALRPAVVHGQVSTLRQISRDQLKITEGTIEPASDGALTISAPKVRAVVASATGQSAELRFRFLGASSEQARLDDGEARQQLGLKLRAKDACNLVYVMWRLQPRSVLSVSVKRNPGQATSAQCGARGYRNVKMNVPLRAPEIGASHTLRADFDSAGSDRLVVRVDGVPAWEGSVGVDAELDGPVGIRTDNVRLEFRLAVGGSALAAGGAP